MQSHVATAQTFQLESKLARWSRHLFPHYGVWLAVFALFCVNCTILQLSEQISVESLWYEFNTVCFILAAVLASDHYWRPKQFNWFTHRLSCSAIFILLAYVFASNLGLYNQLTMTQNWPFADDMLISADRALGFDWLFYAKLMTEHQGLNFALNYAYGTLTGAGLFCAVLLGACLGNRERAVETAFLLVATGIFVVTFASFVPAKAAWTTLADNVLLSRLDAQSGIDHIEPLMLLRGDGPIHIMIAKMIGLATFPSYHTCLGLVILLSARGYRFVAPVGAVIGVMIIAATPIYGGHYFVDVVAGSAVTAAAFMLWKRYLRPRLMADLPAFRDDVYAMPKRIMNLSFT